jgi:site-specific DNA-methyltransferase (adenine-specific)
MTETLHIGDNLEYMKSLQSESIDLIYGDILYGTGRDFGDYKDIKADRKTVEAFYIPRITEMHRLLKNTGSIYLQMDCKISHWIRCIFDDIFGIENFINEIIWCYKLSIATRKVGFNSSHDNIIFGAKNLDKCFFNRDVRNEFKPSQHTLDRYQRNADENGIVVLKNKTLFNHKNSDSIINLNRGIPISWWDIVPVARGNNGQQNEGFYATQKPIELMARIIKASSNEGNICADFFAGSGSFGVAAKKLNRNVILCDINPKAIELSKKRLQSETNLFNYS